MSGLDVKWEIPRVELEVDVRAILEAMADVAVAIVRSKAPHRTGEFADSIRAELVDGGIDIVPTGARNEIIAAVFAKRGDDFFDFSAGDEAAIIAAGQKEFDRQVAAGAARLKGI